MFSSIDEKYHEKLPLSYDEHDSYRDYDPKRIHVSRTQANGLRLSSPAA